MKNTLWHNHFWSIFDECLWMHNATNEHRFENAGLPTEAQNIIKDTMNVLDDITDYIINSGEKFYYNIPYKLSGDVLIVNEEDAKTNYDNLYVTRAIEGPSLLFDIKGNIEAKKPTETNKSIEIKKVDNSGDNGENPSNNGSNIPNSVLNNAEVSKSIDAYKQVDNIKDKITTFVSILNNITPLTGNEEFMNKLYTS